MTPNTRKLITLISLFSVIHVGLSGLLHLTLVKQPFSENSYSYTLIPALGLTSYLLSFVFFAFCALLIFQFKKWAANRKGIQKIRRVGGTVLLFLAIFLYHISWIIYMRIGIFLNSGHLTFTINNLPALLLHILQVEPLAFAFITMLSGTLTAVCFLFVESAICDAILKREQYLSKIGIGLLGLGVFFLAYLALLDVVSPTSLRRNIHGAAYSRSELFLFELRNNSNPLNRLLLHGFKTTNLGVLGGPHIEKELTRPEKKIIPLKNYLNQNDLSQIRKYNVILIVVESLRSDRLRALGGKRRVIPNLDRLAAKSVLFKNSYALSSYSHLTDVFTMSSHYPLRTTELEYFKKGDPAPKVLVQDILKELGYKYAIISSQNEHWQGMLNYLDTGEIDYLFHGATYDGVKYATSTKHGVLRTLKHNIIAAGKVEDHITIGKAKEWINNNSEDPFFLYMNLQNSHYPYRTPRHIKKPFSPYTIDFPASFVSYPKEKTHVMMNRYDNSLHYMDQLLGEFFQVLQSNGLFENTIIVVTGDTGQAFHEHGMVTHGRLIYNEVLRVPFIFYSPRLKPKMNRTLAQQIDIAPTILGELGLSPHPSFQGKDLMRVPEDKNRKLFFFTKGISDFTAIINEGNKLIYDWDNDEYSLFNLKNDPEEKNNLMRRDSPVFLKLEEELHAWQDKQLTYYKRKDIFKAYYPPNHD